MKKSVYFDMIDRDSWPDPKELKPYFFGLPGQEWFDTGGNDGASISASGLYGTEGGVPGKTRVDLYLHLYGKPGLGVLLFYHKYGGGYREAFTSKGDMTLLREYVRDLHQTLLPVGLFIPFPKAYDAVKEFIETDGQLPKCIEWVANKDLPPGTFPDAGEEWAKRYAEQQRQKFD
jgi:Immunity protein Imm1